MTAGGFAIRRKRDGLYLDRRHGVYQWRPTPAFISTDSKARAAVRIDMGLDLSEVEIIARADMKVRL